MTSYTVTFGTAFAPFGTFQEDQMRGGLGDGYFYTTVDSTERVRLWNVSNPSTPTHSLLNSTNPIYRAAHNNLGKCWTLRTNGAPTRYLAEVTQSGGTLTLTNYGTLSSTGSSLFVSSDEPVEDSVP